jgi:hypothetical protein
MDTSSRWNALFHHLSQLPFSDANSVRTWGTDQTDPALNSLSGTSLIISAGFWFSVDSLTSTTKTTIVNYVNQHKDDDSILIWSIGNEVHLGHEDQLEAIFTFIDDVGSAIKEVDPNHPTMTVIAELPDNLFPYLKNLTFIDIIGINAYTYADSIGGRYTASNISKPFILTEFGPIGPWDGASKTSFGSFIEPSSTSRTVTYRNSYESTVKGYEERNCLGSYAFLWGWKNETTPTWFGMFYRDGSRLGPVETMTELWNEGSFPNDWNHIPTIGNVVISKTDNISVNEILNVECSANDSDGDSLTWTFELIDEAIVNGGYESYQNGIESVSGNTAIVRPRKIGVFRVYAVVRDGHENAAFSSIPINVNRIAATETPDQTNHLSGTDGKAGNTQTGLRTDGQVANTGAIVGGTVGGIVGIGLIVGLIICCVQRRKDTTADGWTKA